MSTASAAAVVAPRFLAIFTSHGRGDTGTTGHVYDSERKRSLCGVETSRPWLNWETAGDEQGGDIHGPALLRWLTDAGTAYSCGTCLRLYRRQCERVSR